MEYAFERVQRNDSIKMNLTAAFVRAYNTLILKLQLWSKEKPNFPSHRLGSGYLAAKCRTFFPFPS